MPLPPYSPMSQCRKCLAIEAHTAWRPAGRCVVDADGELSTIEAHDGSLGVERMCRRCRRCGYHWDEAPADATPSAADRPRFPLAG